MNENKRLDAFFWGGALLWVGLVFGAETLNLLPEIGEASAWSWIFLGAGVLSIVLNLLSLFSDNFEDPGLWDWVWGVIFTLIGVGGFTTINISWPLILILVGAGMLIKTFSTRSVQT